MSKLKMFKGEVDWIIAETAEEAYEICLKIYDLDKEDYPENDFVEQPLNIVLKIDFSDDDGTVKEKTIGEFLEEHPKGLFASTEW